MDSQLIFHSGKLSESELSNRYEMIYGAKGSGLLWLPTPWTPPFFLLSRTLYERYEKIATPGGMLADKSAKTNEAYLFNVQEDPSNTLWDTLLESQEYQELEYELRQVAPSDDDYVVVRSSAVDEDLEARGRYKSFSCAASMTELATAVLGVFKSCPCDDGKFMGVLVQRHVEHTRARGHLSNERRVSKKTSSWVCEFDAVSGVGPARIVTFSVSGKGGRNDLSELSCRDKKQLFKRIKDVARWAYSQKKRLHFEWMWDGKRLWVVQGDESKVGKGEFPSAGKLKIGQTASPGHLDVLELDTVIPKGIWSKLDCVKVFREHELPTTNLWVLRNARVLSELAEGKVSKILRRDLKSLLDSPIVIRTDIRRKTGNAKVMLPRTDTVADIEQAETFLIAKSRSLTEEIGGNESLCFIFHRFIPAMASAFGLAEPGRGRAKIDGLWGLPDGLLYYPHDSYDVSSDGTGKIYEYVRFKEEFLDVDDKGKWLPKRAGPPFDWKSSLTDEEIRKIARGTYAIACAEGRTIQLMWFTGIPSGLGHPTCLPWYYSTEEPPRRLPHYDKTLVPKGPVVRNKDDILRIKSLGPGTSTSVIRLRPISELLRSREFIEDVAAMATELEAVVELEGSVLSHAFYLLKSCGCNVVCADPFAPQFKPQQFNKLVRDRIPVRIKSHGETVEVIRLSGEQLTGVLKAKVVEEAVELFWSETNEQCKEELVDLLEVLGTLQKHEGYSKVELESIAGEKRARRGGFEKGFILKETRDVPLIDVETSGGELFDELEDDRDERAALSSVRENAAVIGPQAKKEGPDLVIPLVPPDAGHRHFSGKPFLYKNLGVSVNIRYREMGIVVEITKLEERDKEEYPNQMKLFDF